MPSPCTSSRLKFERALEVEEALLEASKDFFLALCTWPSTAAALLSLLEKESSELPLLSVFLGTALNPPSPGFVQTMLPSGPGTNLPSVNDDWFSETFLACSDARCCCMICDCVCMKLASCEAPSAVPAARLFAASLVDCIALTHSGVGSSAPSASPPQDVQIGLNCLRSSPF